LSKAVSSTCPILAASVDTPRKWLERSTERWIGGSMDKPAQIAQLRARALKYRRLAMYTNDPRTTEALLQMAGEDEAMIKELLAQAD
jgi:hypothetical protein